MKTNATKNIIIIDDDINILNIYKILFKKEENLKIKYFNNPKEALEEIKNNNIDTVITDIEMPELSGIDLIRETQKIKKIEKIIFMSSNIEKYLEEIKIIGGYAFKKPVKKEEILEIVN